MMNVRRLSIVILAFVAALLAFGTLGYRTLEGWSLGESLYMTAITVSTVGFSEVHPLTPVGRLFTVVLIFVGLFTISVIGAYAARMLIDSEIKSILGRKKMKREIAGLRRHCVVCGYGRIGGTICSELKEAGIAFVIIEKDDALVELAETQGYRVLKGDATSDAVLKEAGIERAGSVIAALNSDAHNLFISLAAREMNPEIEIIARGEEPGVESRLLRAGANIVVSPLKLGGRQIARMLLDDLPPTGRHAVAQGMDLTLRQIAHVEPAQRTVDELMCENGALLAVAIQRADGRTEMMPSAQSVVNTHDILFVCTTAEPSRSDEAIRTCESADNLMALHSDHR